MRHINYAEILGKQFSSSAVQQFSSSAVQQFSSSAVQQFSSSAVQQFSSSAGQQVSRSAGQQVTGTSKAICYETPIAPGPELPSANTEVQKRKKRDQATHNAKADAHGDSKGEHSTVSSGSAPLPLPY